MFGFKSNDQAKKAASAATSPIIPLNEVAELPAQGQEPSRSEPQLKANCDLYRLARFGANLSDAHSCFIFLPASIMAQITCSPETSGADQEQVLVLAGAHSLSTDIILDCKVNRSSGLIGWVSKHSRSIHVSPFELDSRTLGIYSTDQKLKSFIGIPIALDFPGGPGCGSGVIACDSKKSFAFSKIQGKLLEDLAAEISNTVQLLVLYSSQGQSDIAWQTFLRRGEELASAVGNTSIDVLRVKFTNGEQLEMQLGTSAHLALSEQIFRLFQQALPPHYPITRLVNGDILVCLDSMMASFYENKFRALCEHLAVNGRRPMVDFVRSSSRDKKRKALSIEALATLTCRAEHITDASGLKFEKDVANEYRRA